MTGISFLLPIALGLGLLGLVAFFWSVRSGQFEDLDGASMRILIDDEEEKFPVPSREPANELVSEKSPDDPHQK